MNPRAFALAITLCACGGAAETGLFGANAGDDGGTFDASSNDASNDASSDAAPTNDATNDGPDMRDAMPLPDARPPPHDAAQGDPGIYCGTQGARTAYCAPTQQECCVTGNAGSMQYSCKAAGSLSCFGLTIPCDDSADCAGQICCGVQDMGATHYVSVSCQATCDPQGPGGEPQRIFCDPNVTPSECPMGTACTMSAFLPGYSVCL
jgi:hypothetical protein